MSIYNKKYYEDNKEKILKSNRKYQVANPEKMREYRRKYYVKNKEELLLREKQDPELKARKDMAKEKYQYKKRYGANKEDYNRLFEEQEGGCAICGEPETKEQRGKIVKLAIDHDHKTGKIRGLLCHKHNIALGMFEDDIFLLLDAIKYLNREMLQ